jgi:hypothetical protein
LCCGRCGEKTTRKEKKKNPPADVTHTQPLQLPASTVAPCPPIARFPLNNKNSDASRTRGYSLRTNQRRHQNKGSSTLLHHSAPHIISHHRKSRRNFLYSSTMSAFDVLILPLRIAQFVLAIVILGLTAYGMFCGSLTLLSGLQKRLMLFSQSSMSGTAPIRPAGRRRRSTSCCSAPSGPCWQWPTLSSLLCTTRLPPTSLASWLPSSSP